MAQRTAFLNSDAKGFNKDFHHTWISNYMLKQPGVMFSNYSTKPEFALGNGQISGGKAIIRCTRTTGTFAGEEILACFESTSTENISTAGNKKVYIEIPEVYVNDSTAITDSLTQGANLNVGRIVSSDSYPTHSNYIPLWEITNGDWQNATDLRPEVLRRGKPNTLSYFGGNGEEERINIDNASLNKYLMSNGAGVAPTWEEGGGGGGGGSGENFKRAFTADEDLLAKSMFGVEVQNSITDVDGTIDVGTVSSSRVFFVQVLNGNTFNSIVLNLAAVNSPADTLSVRIETLDSNGLPTGTLIDVGAYATVTPTAAATDMTISLSGMIEGLSAHTKVAIVLSRTGSVSSANYYTLGCKEGVKVISKIYAYGESYQPIAYSGCVSCDGFADEAVVQATSLNGVEPIGYCESGALAGNDFMGTLQGTVDYEGATTGTKYYLDETGTLSTSGSDLVGVGLEHNVLQIALATGQSLQISPNFGDGSDGCCVITDDTVMEAREYNFTDFIVCSGADVSFRGEGVPVIRACGTFCNRGEIYTQSLCLCNNCGVYFTVGGARYNINNKQNIYPSELTCTGGASYYAGAGGDYGCTGCAGPCVGGAACNENGGGGGGFTCAGCAANANCGGNGGEMCATGTYATCCVGSGGGGYGCRCGGKGGLVCLTGNLSVCGLRAGNGGNSVRTGGGGGSIKGCCTISVGDGNMFAGRGGDGGWGGDGGSISGYPNICGVGNYMVIWGGSGGCGYGGTGGNGGDVFVNCFMTNTSQETCFSGGWGGYGCRTGGNGGEAMVCVPSGYTVVVGGSGGVGRCCGGDGGYASINGLSTNPAWNECGVVKGGDGGGTLQGPRCGSAYSNPPISGNGGSAHIEDITLNCYVCVCGGKGGSGIAGHYGLTIFANNFYNNEIDATGGDAGNGGEASACCVCQNNGGYTLYGGDGGNGGNGGNVFVMYNNLCNKGRIVASGGRGGLGGKPNGRNGKDGTDGIVMLVKFQE